MRCKTNGKSTARADLSVHVICSERRKIDPVEIFRSGIIRRIRTGNNRSEFKIVEFLGRRLAVVAIAATSRL